jgi:hypothetical protein
MQLLDKQYSQQVGLLVVDLEATVEINTKAVCGKKY